MTFLICDDTSVESPTYILFQSLFFLTKTMCFTIKSKFDNWNIHVIEHYTI